MRRPRTLAEWAVVVLGVCVALVVAQMVLHWVAG